jgi:two-component system, sensor histidine kinase and response regulator
MSKYSRTVLVVEDDAHLMEGIREILELDEYEVVTASSGVHGLDVLREMPRLPDLIVSDIMMPKMDGYQFFEAVRSESDWVMIPFIFLTAKGEKADIRLGKSMGADDYVTKPFSAEDLLVAVSSKLARKEQLQSVFSAQVVNMKRRILTILNHEFRTPLTYVIAYADMLSRDADHMSLAEMRDFLKGVNAGAERLRRLIENFIFLVELETGEIELTYSWRKHSVSNYSQVIDIAMRYVRPAFESRHQKLDVSIQPNTPPMMGDEEYLAAALARLMDNASKFSPHNATIRISIFPNDLGCPTLMVSDQGRGIPQTELDNIFESFYQIDRQQYEDQGAGSGLAIVKGVVRIHSGTVSVQSEENKGTSFSLVFQPLQ